VLSSMLVMICLCVVCCVAILCLPWPLPCAPTLPVPWPRRGLTISYYLVARLGSGLLATVALDAFVFGCAAAGLVLAGLFASAVGHGGLLCSSLVLLLCRGVVCRGLLGCGHHRASSL
jgi:hypothetical protein